ncbi:MAG: DUF484 family protein [Burkholderiales bacterium]
MRPEDVARYLKQNPQFFEDYAEMLAEIHIPHPHGGRAIPLSERQIVSLREKNRLLESRLRELVDFGEENDAIGDRVHRAAIRLYQPQGLESLLQTLQQCLRDDFQVPAVAIRMWGDEQHSQIPEFAPVSTEVRGFAESLTQPYCCAQPMFESAEWLGSAQQGLASFAYVPLSAEQTFGLVTLASEDARRFYPEMGTLYLKRLGELASAAVSRLL